MSAAVAEFEAVTKDYPTGVLRPRPLRAVEDVSLRIEAGEVFGLVGPNRAGKTTLIKLLLSLAQPTAGTVRRLGEPAARRETLAHVGYVHENQAFPRYLSATELLEFYGALSLLEEPVVRQRAAELLEKVGLADRGNEPIARFSKGMVQRLGLAQALMNDPELLVLDEPAEGLDLLGRRLVHEVVAEQRRLGRSVLLVTHVAADVEVLCDRLAVIVRGRVAFCGKTNDLRHAAGNARPLERALMELYSQN